MNYHRNMSNTLPIVVPAFASALDSEEKSMQFFMAIGNKLTPDQRDYLQSLVSPDGNREPLEESICLNQNQFQQWMDDRQRAFEESGLDPDIARDFVDKQNSRIRSDLDDLLDLFASGPDKLLQSAVDNILSDDSCANPNALATIENTPAANDLNTLVNALFDPLEAAFIDDTIEWNFFERLVDSPGILSLILADKKGFTLNYHNSVNDSAILRFFLPNPGEIPETVSIQMYKYLQNSNFQMIDGVVDIPYSNELGGNDEFNSLIRYSENLKNFDYRIKITSNNESRITESSQFKIDGFSAGLVVKSDSKFAKLEMIRKYIRNRWFGFKQVKITERSAMKLKDSVNNMLFSPFAKSLVKSSLDGPSSGFIHSAVVEEITKEDLKYVAPDGSDYDFEEEQAILGRSATQNPRVVFLDPSENGGSYAKPKYYVKPQDQVGWRKIAKVFVPNTEQEGDPYTFLDIPDIAKRISASMNSLKANEKLQIPPDEMIEAPFDKVSSSTTLATIEGNIIATIRVFLADFYIRAMPVIANVKMTDDNYDDLLSAFIVQNMKESMIGQQSSKASIYSSYIYWLLFLEQAAQSFDRKYGASLEVINNNRNAGLSKKLKKLEQDLYNNNSNILKIRSAQNNFLGDDGTIAPNLVKEKIWSLKTPVASEPLRIKVESLEQTIASREFASETSELGQSKKFLDEMEEMREELELLKEQQFVYENKQRYGDNVIRGSMIIAYGKDYWKKFGLEKKEWRDLVKAIPLVKAKNKYGFVSDAKFSINLENLNLQEMNFASKIFSISVVEKECEQILQFLVKEQIEHYKNHFSEVAEPHVTDVNRFFLGASNTFSNMPSLGIENETYDNIRSCISNPEKQNPFDGREMSSEEAEFINKNGTFYFEKYMRINEKEGSPLQNRDELLKGVVSPGRFMQFLKSQESSIDTSKPISDYFGNAEIINTDGVESYSGTTGVKFGVRLCYMPPEGMIKFNPSPSELIRAKNSKSFIFKEAKVQAKPEAISKAFDIAKENSDEAMLLLAAAVPGLGAALALAGVGGDEFEKVMEIVEDFIPLTTLPASRHIFPICSYEEEISDDPISFYLDLGDANFNQQISCYVDGLLSTPQFDFLFNRAFNVKKVPSILSIYSYINFLNALGVDGDERDGSEDADLNANNLSKVFNDSKKELKKMFITLYRRQDFDPDEDETSDKNSVKGKNKRLNETLDHVVMSKEIPWFDKINRTLENPFIGSVLGKNKYAKVFNLAGSLFDLLPDKE